jgi:tetratricopeptide (TPR) repeat protein
VSKRIILFAAGLCAILSKPPAAFGAGPSYLADAIQAELAKLTTAIIDAQERHDSYVQLARMLHLSGDIEGAAAAWENAVYANPELRDDTALVESAACYVSMGDWDKADSTVKLILLTVRDNKDISRRATHLNGQIEAFRHGNTTTLETIANNDEYSAFHPAAYYTLWQVSGKDEYKTKLLNKYPYSPEAYSIMTNEDAPRVSALPSANWLLFPGGEEFNPSPAEPAPPSSQTQTPAKTAAATQNATSTAKRAGNTGGQLLQTGIYTNKKNADSQADRLKTAGYSAAVSTHKINGRQYWTVSVRIPSSSTQQTMIQRLKEHGFNALPAP